jgi:hypothetical protein
MPISITKSSIEKEDYTIRDTILKRNNIPNEYRRINMIVFVKEDSHYYQLDSDLTTWIDLGLSIKEAKTFSILNTINDRNNIPSRIYGMIVYVEDVNRYYRLLSGLTNDDWEDLGETLSQNLKNYSIVSTIANRDLISTRYYEMVVFVQENSNYYTLRDGITNSDWINLGFTLTRNIKEFSTVETLIERNNIPITQRKKGMIISVRQNNRSYKLINNLKNSDWEDLGETQGGFDSKDSLNNIGGAYQMASLRNAHAFEMNWTTRTNSIDNQWRSVAWSPELGIFVAVADSGTGTRVMTSSNAINWTTRTSAADNWWYSVTWSPKLMLFVAVAFGASSNRVMISSNGINWTGYSGLDGRWQSICWSQELSIFVAVADGTDSTVNKLVMTSGDGINWTYRTGIAVNIWWSVCWSPELRLFVAVSIDGTTQVMTSPDGITWTGRTQSATLQWRSIAWSPQLSIFVAVAYTGSTNRVMTSPNGINWTSRTSAADNNWSSVCWSPELMLFVAVATTGSANRVMTSPDGINWTIRTGLTNNSWWNVIWCSELGTFVSVSIDGVGTRVMTSLTDARILQYRPRYNKTFGYNSFENIFIKKSVINSDWQSICWSPELEIFVAVADVGTNRVMTSIDGVTWTPRVTPINIQWYSATWSPELMIFVALGWNLGSLQSIITSLDGITWTIRNASQDELWSSVTWSPQLGIFVAVADSGTNKVMTSSDGINWTTRITPSNAPPFNSVTWSPQLGRFVAVGNDNINQFMYSSDGINWTTGQTSSVYEWRSVCWSPELRIFVAVSDFSTTNSNNRAMTSPDGITWTIRTTPSSTTGQNWKSVIWVSELKLFIAVGYSIMTSSDGITWTLISNSASLGTNNLFTSITWSPKLGIALGVGEDYSTVVSTPSYVRNKPTKNKIY